jgi:hypothetical protein
MDFLRINAQRVVAIAPRNTPLETPIEDPKKVTQDNGGYPHRYTEIKERGVDRQTQ